MKNVILTVSSDNFSASAWAIDGPDNLYYTVVWYDHTAIKWLFGNGLRRSRAGLDHRNLFLRRYRGLG